MTVGYEESLKVMGVSVKPTLSTLPLTYLKIISSIPAEIALNIWAIAIKELTLPQLIIVISKQSHIKVLDCRHFNYVIKSIFRSKTISIPKHTYTSSFLEVSGFKSCIAVNSLLFNKLIDFIQLQQIEFKSFKINSEQMATLVEQNSVRFNILFEHCSQFDDVSYQKLVELKSLSHKVSFQHRVKHLTFTSNESPESIEEELYELSNLSSLRLSITKYPFSIKPLTQFLKKESSHHITRLTIELVMSDYFTIPLAFDTDLSGLPSTIHVSIIIPEDWSRYKSLNFQSAISANLKAVTKYVKRISVCTSTDNMSELNEISQFPNLQALRVFVYSTGSKTGFFGENSIFSAERKSICQNLMTLELDFINDASKYSLEPFIALKFLRMRNCDVSSLLMNTLTDTISELELVRCSLVGSSTGYFKLPASLTRFVYSTLNMPSMQLPIFSNLYTLKHLKDIEIRISSIIPQTFIDNLSLISESFRLNRLLIECRSRGSLFDWSTLNFSSLAGGLSELELIGNTRDFDLSILPARLESLKLSLNAIKFHNLIPCESIKDLYIDLMSTGNFPTSILNTILSNQKSLRSLDLNLESSYIDLTSFVFPRTLTIFQITTFGDLNDSNGLFRLKLEDLPNSISYFDLKTANNKKFELIAPRVTKNMQKCGLLDSCNNVEEVNEGRHIELRGGN